MLIPLLNVNIVKMIEVEGDQRKHHGAVDKSKEQACVMESNCLCCAKTGPIHQVLVDLMAGRHVGRQAIIQNCIN